MYGKGRGPLESNGDHINVRDDTLYCNRLPP